MAAERVCDTKFDVTSHIAAAVIGAGAANVVVDDDDGIITVEKDGYQAHCRCRHALHLTMIFTDCSFESSGIGRHCIDFDSNKRSR